MANYKMHATLNLSVALPGLLFGGVLFNVSQTLLWIFAGVFVYGTFFAHPDVDLSYNVKLASLRGILGFPFRSYARVFRHRGLSHSFIFGTLSRLLWVAVPIVVVFYMVYQVSPTDAKFLRFLHCYQAPVIAALAGLFAADWGHLIVDKIWDVKQLKNAAYSRRRRSR